MPCSSTSQLTNASAPVLPLTQPQTPSQWNYFVARLQDIINSIRDASNRQPVNVVPADYAVYNGSALPALSISGASAALDTTKHQFGAASLKLTATAATVTVEFSADPVLLPPNADWIESVYIQSSRTAIAGTLALDTPGGSYPVDISGDLLPGTWGRLYGDCDLRADSSTTATMALTLTGCTVGDTFNLEGWQIEHATGSTNLPSPFVNTTVPQGYVDTVDNAVEALANANAAQGAADAANAQLADIASDNILSPAEKPTVIRDYAVITAEQAGIDGQAVAYLGVASAQQVAYDNAITALTAYLATLTAPVAWNNKSGNTTIGGTTFRANFNTVYTTRQTLLNSIYAQAKTWTQLSLFPGQNLIPNPTGALGFSGLPNLSWIGGSQQNMSTRASLFTSVGPMFCLNGVSGSLDQGFESVIPVAASNVSIALAADMDASIVASGSMIIQLRFLNSSQTEIDSTNRPTLTATNGLGMTRYSMTATASNGTAFIAWFVRFTGTLNTPFVIGWRNLKLEVGSTPTPFNDAASQMGNQLTNAGSGQQIGDQRNNRPLVAAGAATAYIASGGALSEVYNSADNTYSVTQAAMTMQVGSSQISYNSWTSPHLAPGTKYYFGLNDSAWAGGSPPLVYSTAQKSTLNNDGYVTVGFYTTGASGGSGGGGGGGGGGTGCVALSAFLLPGVPVSRAKSNMMVDGAADFKLQGKVRITAVQIMTGPCLLITAADGCAVPVTPYTPFTLPDGTTRLAPDMLGELVLTDLSSTGSKVVSVTPIGSWPYALISRQGHESFAAGVEADKRIYSHNSIK